MMLALEPYLMQAIHIFGFGRKEQPQSFTTDITNKEDLEEIGKISIHGHRDLNENTYLWPALVYGLNTGPAKDDK